jgi:hypothetical protein
MRAPGLLFRTCRVPSASPAIKLFHSEVAQLLRQGSQLVGVGDIEFEYLRHRIEFANSSTGDADGTRQHPSTSTGRTSLWDFLKDVPSSSQA